jgi:hypothetical protein
MENEEDLRSHRFEVAVDSMLEFRVYPPSGRAPGQEPWIERMKEATASREPMTILFEGRRFTWHPGSDEILPTVTVPIEDEDDFEAEHFAMERFLSALSFEFGYGVTVFTAAGSGLKKELDPPLLQAKRMKATIFPTPDTIELADTSSELSLCLALVREGMCSTSRALAYLSYWKAVEVAVGDPEHKSWIGPAAEALWPEAGRGSNAWYKRLNETRIAAAHAIPSGERLKYHPDDPALDSRLREDVERARLLAHRAIGERWPNPIRKTGPRY